MLKVVYPVRFLNDITGYLEECPAYSRHYVRPRVEVIYAFDANSIIRKNLEAISRRIYVEPLFPIFTGFELVWWTPREGFLFEKSIDLNGLAPTGYYANPTQQAKKPITPERAALNRKLLRDALRFSPAGIGLLAAGKTVLETVFEGSEIEIYSVVQFGVLSFRVIIDGVLYQYPDFKYFVDRLRRANPRADLVRFDGLVLGQSWLGVPSSLTSFWGDVEGDEGGYSPDKLTADRAFALIRKLETLGVIEFVA